MCVKSFKEIVSHFFEKGASSCFTIVWVILNPLIESVSFLFEFHRGYKYENNGS